MTTQKDPFPQSSGTLYTAAGFYMLRAPALPAEIFLHLSAPSQESEGTAEESDAHLAALQRATYQSLRDLAAQPSIALALAAASPSLAEAFKRLSQEDTSHRAKRTYASLLRYLIRMSTRPTPFGLFAGVAGGIFAEETTLQLANPPLSHIRTRPDMEWLLEVLREVEEDPGLVKQLRVRTNQTAYIAGERVHLACADSYGQKDYREISLRVTPVTRKALEIAARQAIPYMEMQAILLKTFPQATAQQVEHLLWQLWENRFLISDLHPPLTATQPATYLYTYLADLHGSEKICQQLHNVLESATALDRAGISAPVTLLDRLTSCQNQLLPREQSQPPFQIDAALQLKAPHLHSLIGEAAALAATCLLRMTSFPQGSPALQQYRQEFQERYGEYAEVPLLDLLSAENGLDAPAGYDQPPCAYHRLNEPPTPDTSQRDHVLQELVADAINAHQREVELSEETLQRLTCWSPDREQAPRSLEIYLQIHARSCEALDRGEWSAVVNQGGPMSAGRTFGRFFDILDQSTVQKLHALAEQEEALVPDALFAELSYLPRGARTANVAIRPAVRAYEINVGTTPSVPPDRTLSLNDLVVGMRDGRFILRSQRLGKQVIVCQTHMLTVSRAPNVCRFITEVAQDGLPGLQAFGWGDASGALFLPRVVVKAGPQARLVLSVATWHVRADTIMPQGEGSEQLRWLRALRRWRSLWHVPRYVYLTNLDHRLLLDLEHPLMAEELRQQTIKLQDDQRLILQELLPDFEHLWLRDEQGSCYFSEIVVPLLRSDAYQTKTASPASPAFPSRILLPVERRSFPGEAWGYLKLYSTYKQHNALLADLLGNLLHTLQEQNLIDNWFYIRYGDPEPHLRLRFHAERQEAIQPLLASLLQWGSTLARAGSIQRYTLDTYEREVERYGGPEGLDLCEQIFGIDSIISKNILVACEQQRLTLDLPAITVFTLHHFLASWGWNCEQCLQWLQRRTKKYEFRQEFRPQRRMYGELLAPEAPQSNPDLMHQRTLLHQLVRPQEKAVAQIGARIRALSAEETLWRSESEILASLAHMHANRLGEDRTQEDQTLAFWRYTLESMLARSSKKDDGTFEPR